METWVVAVISAAVGGAAGVALGWLLAERKGRVATAAAETGWAVAEQRATALEVSARAQQAMVDALRGQLGDMQTQHATAVADLRGSQQNIEAQKKLLDEANTKLTAAFAAVSGAALERANGMFMEMAKSRFETLSTEATGALEQRKAQIATLLKPLEEMLGTYQKRIGEIEAGRNEAYAALRQQIGMMSATQQALSQQTTQLVGALTRSNVRGQWGEITLRKLVELSGMSPRVDFVEQTSVNTEEGRLRPDMIVKLPGDRNVVVDCKAVLGAFLDAAGATDEATRQTHMKRHAELVRARVKDLAGKAYWSQFQNTPEFVVLFLPGEGFLYAACEHDADLIQDALLQKVILATPTTLMALLRSVEYGWRQQALGENAEEIRKLGIEIYDRLAVLGSNMSKVGKSLDNAVDAYNSSVASLESRLLVSARKMSELGAHSDRDLPDLQSVDKKARELGASLNPEKSPLLPG